MLTALMSAIAALAAAITAYLIYLQVQKMHESILEAKRGQEIVVYLEIARRYDAVYAAFNRLASQELSWESFERRYPTLETKLNSEEWVLIRQVGSFFELIGILVKRKSLDPLMVFSLINVRPELWVKVEDIVKQMRERHNRGLWVNWEELVQERKKYPQAL